MPIELRVGEKVRVAATGSIKTGTAVFTTADPTVAPVVVDESDELGATIMGFKEGSTELALTGQRADGSTVREVDTVTVTAPKGFTFEYGTPVVAERGEIPEAPVKTAPLPVPVAHPVATTPGPAAPSATSHLVPSQAQRAQEAAPVPSWPATSPVDHSVHVSPPTNEEKAIQSDHVVK
jgi:hypothetical protein